MDGPAAPSRTLDVLVVMQSGDFIRFFQSPLELLTERGHNVRLLLGRVGRGRRELQWLEAMTHHSNFTCDIVDHFKGDRWATRATQLRRGLEFVRFLRPEYEESWYFRKRLARAPESVRRLAGLPVVRSRPGRRLLYGTLSAIERALPTPAAAAKYLGRVRPDLVAVCDRGGGNVGSLFSAYARAAKERGIPTAICVNSWDNLTGGQRFRVIPDALVVWNRTQLQEAVQIHEIPVERVVVTGASGFDKWFSWRPRPRSEFLGRVGLDPATQVILWVGGTIGGTLKDLSEPTEAEYATAWLRALRSSRDATLREAGVLLRPHPNRVQEWLAVDLSGIENVAVWPREDAGMPIEVEQQADFFDSIFHARAVVGLNTSAMIEASIIGRPVLTILAPEFHQSQLGTFHFHYLLEASGGAVRVAHSREENFDQLRAALAGEEGETPARANRFVADFVRPLGLERPATPIVVDTLEQLATRSVQPERNPLWVAFLRRLIVLAVRSKGRKGRGLARRVSTTLREMRKTLRQRRRRFLLASWRAPARRARRLTLIWLRAAVRPGVKKARRFFLVWLRAAVSVRLQKSRRWWTTARARVARNGPPNTTTRKT